MLATIGEKEALDDDCDFCMASQMMFFIKVFTHEQ